MKGKAIEERIQPSWFDAAQINKKTLPGHLERAEISARCCGWGGNEEGEEADSDSC